jgi:hypothetical protein
VPQKSWGTIGAPRFGTVDENRSATAYPHPPPRPRQETWLIHCDDIRVGSIVKWQGPMELESSLLFGVASRLPAGSASHSMRPALLSEGGSRAFESRRVRHFGIKLRTPLAADSTPAAATLPVRLPHSALDTPRRSALPRPPTAGVARRRRATPGWRTRPSGSHVVSRIRRGRSTDRRARQGR